MSERKPHREICRLCQEVNRVGFHVPTEVWQASLHESQWNEIVCLACFTRLADERGVEWDRDITFWPVSRITHDRAAPRAGRPGAENERLRGLLSRYGGHHPGCPRGARRPYPCRCGWSVVERDIDGHDIPVHLADPSTGSHTCRWTEGATLWFTGCGYTAELESGGWVLEDWRHCPYCGGRLVVGGDVPMGREEQ